MCSGIQHISNACMQDTFARARTRPSARATIRYLVYKSNAQGTDPSKSVSLFNAFEIAICQDIFYKYMVVVVSSQFISCQHIFFYCMQDSFARLYRKDTHCFCLLPGEAHS